MAVFFYFFTVTVSFNYLLYMLRTKPVLSLYFFKFFACVNEQDIIVLFATFFEDKNAGRLARSLNLKAYLRENRLATGIPLEVTWIPEDWDSIAALTDKAA